MTDQVIHIGRAVKSKKEQQVYDPMSFVPSVAVHPNDEGKVSDIRVLNDNYMISVDWNVAPKITMLYGSMPYLGKFLDYCELM